MRILVLEPENYSPEALAILGEAGELSFGPLSRGELLARLPEVDVLVIRLAHAIDREVLDHAPRLKAIVSPTTGLDHIDLTEAEARGVRVTSLRGEVDFLRSIPATAELTWGLLLALVRNIPGAFQSVQAGQWDRDSYKGHDLAGRALGIAGLGRIGEKIARYAQAFGMRVVAFDPRKTEWMDGIERVHSLRELCATSQVLCVHVPLNEETRGLIGAAEMATLPTGALLVNTARGEVLDEDALLDALESGHLAGAALDVIHNERGERSQRLLDYARKHDNLIITPHIGGATYESMAATEIFVARKLREFLAGREESKA